MKIIFKFSELSEDTEAFNDVVALNTQDILHDIYEGVASGHNKKYLIKCGIRQNSDVVS